MGLLTWIIQRFIRTDNAEYTETENPRKQSTTRIPKSDFTSTQTTIRAINQTPIPQNQDFLYGMLFGSFKSDFETIKEKLGSIHTDVTDNHTVILGQSDKNHQEIIGLLGEHRKQLSEFIENAEKHLKQAKLPPSISKDLKQNIKVAKLSLRQAEIHEIAQQNKQVTAKQISKQLRIAENTATEHLRKLERSGYLERKQRGQYQLMS